MPLSKPAEGREAIHTRRVTCEGFRRSDGLWDIEGHMTDVKTYSYTTPERGEIAAGTPVHDMWLRLTVNDDLTVVAVEAVTDRAPFPAVCPNIAPAYQQVVGLTIGRGWTKALKERLGGVRGCTHLLELLGPMATTAYQTIAPILARAAKAKREENGEKMVNFPLLNTCYAFKSDSEVIQRHAPAFYTGLKDGEISPDPSSASGMHGE